MKNKVGNAAGGSKSLAGTLNTLKTDPTIKKKSSNQNSIKIKGSLKAPNAHKKPVEKKKKEGKNVGSIVNKKDNGEAQTNQKDQEKFGGLIFMCNGITKLDCFQFMVMGLPQSRQALVESIKPGLKLFLYDFGARLLYGIYEATSPGGMKLEPTAFKGDFPAQVRFRVHTSCSPLCLSVFKTAIKDIFDANQKFRTELTVQQVDKLIELFQNSKLEPNARARPIVPAVEDPSHPQQSLPTPVPQLTTCPLEPRPTVPVVEAASFLHQPLLPAPVPLVPRPIAPAMEAPSFTHHSLLPAPVPLAPRPLLLATEPHSFMHQSLLPTPVPLAPRPILAAVEASSHPHQQTLPGRLHIPHESGRYYVPPVHKDLVSTQSEATPRDPLSLGEKEYRTYGLIREHPVPAPATIPGPASGPASLSAPCDPLSLGEKEYRTYGLIRERPVPPSATIPRPASGPVPVSAPCYPLSLCEKEYHTYGLIRERPVPGPATNPGPVSIPVPESYRGMGDTYSTYPLGLSPADPYAVPSRRTPYVTEVDYHGDPLPRRGNERGYKLRASAEVAAMRLAPHGDQIYSNSSRAEVPHGGQLVDKHLAEEAGRLYPTYSANAQSDHNGRQQQPVNRAVESLPVSSRYAFAGPSLSYR